MSSETEIKYKANLILEVIGHPPEHLEPALKEVIDKISNEKGVTLEDSKINKPKELEAKKGFFTTFAEVEVEVDDLLVLIRLTFKYMPSFVELVSPENAIFGNNKFNEFLNEVARRLHRYEDLARVFQVEKARLEKRIRELEKKK